jgi:hypothetical protein
VAEQLPSRYFWLGIISRPIRRRNRKNTNKFPKIKNSQFVHKIFAFTVDICVQYQTPAVNFAAIPINPRTNATRL